MLDAQELRRRLITAMDSASPRVSSAMLAKECKVSAQAVNGWRKTGRVAKRHLPRIAALTAKPLDYFLGETSDTITTNYGLVLQLEEAEAMKRLQDAIPDFRRYVLGLAMMSRPQQELMLQTMRQAVPDYQVEKAFGPTPPKKERERR